MADFGLRPDGSPKGRGYFGELKNKDGSTSTELTIGVDLGQGEENIPLLVPTLTRKDIEHIQSGEDPTDDMIDKAIKFAIARKREGLPAYALPEEEGLYRVPEE